MEPLDIPFLQCLIDPFRIEQVSLALDQEERQLINIAPWPSFNYQPYTAFSIAHNGSHIFLKYYVEEESVAAIYRETNGPVYNDSCVEFFIAFDGDENYYNVEFNCAGTGHIGFGNRKDDRQAIPVKLVEKIRHQTSLRTGSDFGDDLIRWELSLIIPVDIFYHHQLKSLINKQYRVNFYKCGDKLPKPHYLTWAHINSAEPNFHLPGFFRPVRFAGNE